MSKFLSIGFAFWSLSNWAIDPGPADKMDVAVKTTFRCD